MQETYDVIVIGSGAAGTMAALRAHDLGQSVLVLEKTHKFGGTSATSGGVMWVPIHGLGGNDDSREQALSYLDAVSSGPVRRDRIEALVDGGPQMIRYLTDMGVGLTTKEWPDYFPDAPGARVDRCVVHPLFDGHRLGRRFPKLREQFTRFKLFNRYSMDFEEAYAIAARAPGWLKTLGRVTSRYWLDPQARMETRRDRWLSLGAALMGALHEQLAKRNVEVRLDTTVRKLLYENGRIVGVEADNQGRTYPVSARKGVMIAAGGFEKNQRLRERFLTIPGDVKWSSTPEDGSWGEAMEAAMEIGASTEFTETTWMVPTMILPIRNVSNFEETHQAVFDVGRPHSVCVNRNGDRFVDESSGYDRFGNGMVDDHQKTGANAPCWLIFDATFRQKFPAGGIMPTAIMPDRKIPIDWWDAYVFKARSVGELARKIHVDPAALERTVNNMNKYAVTGVDPEYGRGNDIYDQAFGDPNIKPNPCLGSIDRAPFYAIRIYLGDIGSKGGLKADACGRVLDGNDKPLPGLYAAGNASGSPFGNCYPGAGGSIGPAMVFAWLAMNDLARETAGSAAEKTPEFAAE